MNGTNSNKLVDICQFNNGDIWHIVHSFTLPWDVGSARCGDIGIITAFKSIHLEILYMAEICIDCLNPFSSGPKIHVFKYDELGSSIDLYWRMRKQMNKRIEEFYSCKDGNESESEEINEKYCCQQPILEKGGL